MKRKLLILLTLPVIFCSASIMKHVLNYDPNLVNISVAPWENNKYYMVTMSRKNERIKAKYFAAKDASGNSVYDRYTSWANGKNIVLLSSGTYMNNSNEPVGLTIDNGVIVNRNLTSDFDGLVVVYATGGIAVSNLKEGNFHMKCGGEDKTFDIRDSRQRYDFMQCAAQVEATVFQTHLLVYKDQLKIYSNSSPTKRERRFLAVCKDEDGVLQHVIVHSPTESSLYDGTKWVYEFLKESASMSEIIFMLNLDTGSQDVFTLYDKSGNISPVIKGKQPPSVAVNLLTYYYQ
jgi:hypothetical protein